MFALHSNFSFRADPPDLTIQRNLAEFLHLLTQEFARSSFDRLPGYVSGLHRLAQSFSPCTFSACWSDTANCPKALTSAQPFLGMLLELQDNYCTSLTQLVQLLRLIAQLFAGCLENSFVQSANQPREKDQHMHVESELLDRVLLVYLRLLNLYFTVLRETSTKLPGGSLASPLFSRAGWSGTGEENGLSESR